MNRDFAFSIAGALMEHFLERTTLVHLHQCIVLILRKRSKLNEETLFMSWWRSAIKEVDNWGPKKYLGKLPDCTIKNTPRTCTGSEKNE